MRLLLINTANTAALPATKTNTKTASAEPVEVRLSGSRIIDRRPSTGSGLTAFFVRGGLGMKLRSIQTAKSPASDTANNSTQTNIQTITETITKTASAEPVEVRLSALRAIDRRLSKGSALTDLVAIDRFTRNFMRGSRI